jgi:hypothetical protein
MNITHSQILTYAGIDPIIINEFIKNLMKYEKSIINFDHLEIFKMAIYKMAPDISDSETLNFVGTLEYINNFLKSELDLADEYKELDLKKLIAKRVIRSKETDQVNRYEIYKEDVVNYCLLLAVGGIAKKKDLFNPDTKLAGLNSAVRTMYIPQKSHKKGISKTDTLNQSIILMMQEKNVFNILKDSISESTK